MDRLYFLLFHFCIVFIYEVIPNAAYTLTQSESVRDGQTLISRGGTFELGFFNPPNSENRYLGIWYKKIPLQTVVWVANRDSPLNDTSGVLKIGSDGNLVVVVNTTESVVWSSNSSRIGGSPSVEFLESGNLVLREARNDDSKSYIWQSFDYPGDTFLPGMKLGWNFKTGMSRYISAWRNVDDPSRGDFTYSMDRTGYLEAVIRNVSNKYCRSGPWNGLRFSGAPDLEHNPIFTYEVVHNDEEKYFMYHLVDKSVVFRIVLKETSTEGNLQRFTWVEKSNNWVLLASIPRDRCDYYALCGAYGICDMGGVVVCQCMKGFEPKSPQEWRRTDWSQGCQRQTPVNCTKGEGFRKYPGVRLPDTTGTWVNESMNLEECRVNCLKNCSCMAYSNSDIRGYGSGCIMWFTYLVDIRQLNDGGQDLYIRMAASALDSEAKSRTKVPLILIISVTCFAGIFCLGLGGWWFWKKRNRRGGSEDNDFELPLYDLKTIEAATNNFSFQNKLGEGGFGPVYKGLLQDGQAVAVKRLSKDSIQGVDEFKNEVLLISKLQHRNLVKLLGCCIQGETMLVYEYMQNKSLDSFIFVEAKSSVLCWQKRYQIILGIARGLLYLHHDSRLRIIHRDLKVSNILLDDDMIPKISDFGMARIFRGDQMEAQTKRVVGTYGYMSPEYAIDGHFSVKSDVFSFGVLVLEIITGKKNRGFCHADHELNLLGHAWRLWCEDKSMELVDKSMGNSYSIEEVSRCIHIGLLCVQKGVERRPTMPSVLLMLSSETVCLPKPEPPGFYFERSIPNDENSSCTDKESFISYEVNYSVLEPR